MSGIMDELSGMDGGGSMGPSAASMGGPNMSPSMFSRLSPSMTPDPEEMERQAQAAQFHKSAAFSGMHVETYDLGAPKRVKAYEKVMTEIFAGLQAKTHVILFSERKFVEAPEPRWVAHIEWAEFEFKKVAVEPIASAEGQKQ